MADMKKYASGLLRPEDLQGGTRIEKIINVYVNERLNAPILTFESGDEMVAWNSICRVLGREYGYESDEWVGHTIEISIGIYTNKDGEQKENIIVKPVSSRDQKDKEVVPRSKDLDDQIPF